MGGGNPLSRVGNFFSREVFGHNPFSQEGFVGRPYNSFSDMGEKAGAAVGIDTKYVDDKNKEADAAAKAAIRQAEFEASAKAGLERLALRRKKGFLASMLVTPGSTLGSSSSLGVATGSGT